jgi:hypothetical protein
MVKEIPMDEKRYLLKMTLINQGLVPDSEAAWDALVEHIDVHKYYQNEPLDFPLEWGEAVFSWIDSVYEPLAEAVSGDSLGEAFPELTPMDLLFSVSTHWQYLKERNPAASASEAARDYLDRFGSIC